MKRILSIFICVMIFASLTASATTVEFIIGGTTMASVQNNTGDRQLKTSKLLAAPFIANDRTMVPVRALSESFNCQVFWNPDLREVKIVSADKEIKLYIDSTTAYVSGTEITLDAAPVIVGDITFVPVRFVTENMGYNVSFVPGVNSVMVYDQPDFINIDGEAVPFPNADLLNFDLYLKYNDHPATSELADYRSFADLLINLYDYYDRYAKKNSLDISADNTSDDSDYAECYNSNILKGELGVYYNYILSEAAVYEHLATVHNDEINELYKNEYTCAKHILISFDTYSEDDAFELAEAVYNKALSGVDFDTLINTYNEDPGMSQNPDGYVFTKNEMVKEFEETSFSLAPGEISAPVKTTYGYHIIMGMELPEISKDIKASYVDTLYIKPMIEEMQNKLNN